MLALAEAGAGTPGWYFIVGTICALVGMAFGFHKYYSSQRKSWLGEGESRARTAEAIESNTAANRANTEAIGKMTDKLDRFIDSVRTEMNSHDIRLTKIEAKNTGRSVRE